MGRNVATVEGAEVKVRLTKEDITKAIESQATQFNRFHITRCCPIYQALNRRFKGEIGSVTFKTAYFAWYSDKEFMLKLDDIASEITHLPATDWPILQPITFEAKKVRTDYQDEE